VTAPGRRTAAPLRWAWPAYVCAAALLVYAVEKGWYATEGKLGLPGGPRVPDEVYAELPTSHYVSGPSRRSGLFGALLALATVLRWGGRIPRWIMLALLWGALVPLRQSPGVRVRR
jgi:hypothetical protein